MQVFSSIKPLPLHTPPFCFLAKKKLAFTILSVFFLFPILGRGMSFSSVGNRFHPTDEELVHHFLMRKLLGYDDSIPEFKVCNYEPWQLRVVLKKKLNDLAGYFFSPHDYKYSGSLRFNRRTKAGFWKFTGKPRKVINMRTKKVIGTKTYLVFYKNGDPKPIKTGFIMHEYDTISKGKFLLYKLMVKLEESDHKASPPEFESPNLSPTTINSSWDENEDLCDFEKQNDITVSAPDFRSQILHEKTDTSTPKMASWSEITEAEATLLVGPETFFDQVKALVEPEEYSIKPSLFYEDCRSYYYTSFNTSAVPSG